MIIFTKINKSVKFKLHIQNMVRIFHKDKSVFVEKIDIVESSYKNKKFKTLFINNDILLKKNDIIEYNCQCQAIIREKFLFKAKFLDKKFLCKKCFKELNSIKKYGVSHPNKLKSFGQKISEIYNNKSDEEKLKISQKRRQTNLEKYGGNSPASSQEVYNKMKNSIKKKYNRECNLTDIEIKTQGMLKKYGVENPLQSEKIKNKIKQNNLEKYGVEFPQKNPINIQNHIVSSLTRSFHNLKNLKSFPLFTLDDWLKKNNKYQKFQWKCKTCSFEFHDYYANGIDPRCSKCFPKNSGISNLDDAEGNVLGL